MVKLTPSGRANPCPICGRHEDGDCRTSETKILCWHGTTHGPPDGLRPGQVLDGGWAYTGETDCGGWAVFVAHEGRSSPRSAGSSPRSVRDSPRSAAPAGEMEAFLLLEQAGQLEDQEGFRGSLAQAKAYSTRWREFSQAGGTDQDAARAVELEMETIRGTDRLTPEQVVASLREAARQQGPTTLDDARQTLARALADGATRADLATLTAQLGRETELGGAAIAAVLRALEQEQAAADAVAAEGERLAQAAGRRDGGDYLSLGQMFPAGLAASIARLTEFLPVDDPTSVLVFLATAAGTMKLGSEIIASRRLGWAAPLNLYAAMVGRSGIKKDPVYSLLMTRPLAPIAADLAKAHQRAMAEWREENRGKKKSEQSDPPRPTFIACAEFTGEALTSQLEHQESRGLGLLIRRSELAGLFGGLNAYRKGRGGDEEQLLEAYDGGGHSSLRVSAEGGGRFYERAQLSIFGGIQPAVLRGLVGTGEDASGLWARFAFAPVPDRVVPLPADDSEEEAAISQWAAQHLAEVAHDLFRLPQVVLTLTDDARAILFDYETRCQGDAQRSELDAMRAAWSKAPGKVLRVAGLLHLIHRVCPDGEHGELVSAAMVDRAQCLVDHLTQWALSLHQAAAAGDATDLMRLVHSLAMAADAPIGWSRISQRLSVKQRRELDSAAALAAVDGLVALGVGVREEGSRRGVWTYRATRDLPQ